MHSRDEGDVFCAGNSELNQNHLDPSEWDQLADAISIQERFQSATLHMIHDISEQHIILVDMDFLRTTLTSVFPKYRTYPR
jgi:hypothetical protein